MNITGHGLQQAIRERKALLEVLNTQLGESLRQFEEDDKGDPLVISQEILKVERDLATMQCAQDLYNQKVTGSCMGETISLGHAIKLVGGIGRMEKFWRQAAAPKRDRYHYTRDGERSKDTEYAKPQVTAKQALDEHMKYSKTASALRAFIAQANTTPMPVEDIGLSPLYFG